MIDKRELRIGNQVFVDGHREIYFTILQLRSNVAVVKGASTFQAEYEILTPVPLTRDILEKNQFTGDVYMQKEIGQNLTLGIQMADGIDLYELSLMGEPIQPEKKAGGKSSDNGTGSAYSLAGAGTIRLLPIRYLHQLQNIIFEIGEKQTPTR